MQIFSIFPKKTLILALILFIILLVLAFFLLRPAEKNPKNIGTQNTTTPTQQPQDVQKTPLFRRADELDQKYLIKFNIPEGFVLPDSIDNVGVDRNIDSTFIEQLKNRLKVTENPISSGTLLFFQSSDKTKTLAIDSLTGFIRYSVQLAKNDTNKSINRFDAVKISEDFLNDLDVVSITPNTEEVEEYATGPSGDLVESTNQQTTSLYKISYRQSYNGIPVFYQFSTPATITVMIDTKGNTRQVEFFNIRPTNKLGTIKIDFEKIKERVIGGEYSIVKADKPELESPKSGTITITKASLGYFDDKSAINFFPIVLLEGTLQPTGKSVSLYYSIIND